MRFFLAIAAITALVLLTSTQANVCSLPPSQTGMCRARIPAWSYDSETNSCVRYIFGGCGGNNNRFASQGACERQCKKRYGEIAPKKT